MNIPLTEKKNLQMNACISQKYKPHQGDNADISLKMTKTMSLQ
jgi:hypothetical protein